MNGFHKAVAVAVCTTAFSIGLAASALAAGVLNLGPILPQNPAFGESAQFSVYAWNGGPAKTTQVECWFSGRHGMQTAHWFVTTDKVQGRATFTRQIPREWKTLDTWVDLNVSCDRIAARNMWRVRGK